MNDSIKKMLRLIDKDLMITKVFYETIQKKSVDRRVDAVLSPAPCACRSCGSTVVDGNGKVIVVKNGNIGFEPKVSSSKSQIIFKKQKIKTSFPF